MTRTDGRSKGGAGRPGYRGPNGMPMRNRLLGNLREGDTYRGGSRGGAVIWGMEEAFMPRGKTSDHRVMKLLERRATQGHALTKFEEAELMQAGALDADGFAVYGRYPRGFLAHIVRLQLLGDVTRDEILHVCSGTLSATEKWTVDLRPEARPTVIANGTRLPFIDAWFKAIMLDPPYSDAYARDLYGTENPRPSWLLKEAARVVRPGGRIGILHVALPFLPPACAFVKSYGITTGLGYRIRAFTVYQRTQEALPLEGVS